MPHSSSVMPGMTATAEQYNDLRLDALEKTRESHIPLFVAIGTCTPFGTSASLGTPTTNYLFNNPSRSVFVDGALYSGATCYLDCEYYYDTTSSSVQAYQGTMALYDQSAGSAITESIIHSYGADRYVVYRSRSGGFTLPGSEACLTLAGRVGTVPGKGGSTAVTLRVLSARLIIRS